MKKHLDVLAQYATQPFEDSPVLFAFCIVFISLTICSIIGPILDMFENNIVRNKILLIKRKFRLHTLKKIRTRDVRLTHMHIAKKVVTTANL